MIKKLLLGVVGLAVLVAAFGAYKNMQKPADLWPATGKMASCGERAACVSSLATDEARQIAPLGYPGHDVVLVRERLEQAIRAVPGASIQTATPEYLHVVFKGRFALNDDAEFLIEPAVIQVRSAARLQLGDAAAQRARIEKLREAFEKLFAIPA